MTVYKNAKWTGRHHDCMNVVACTTAGERPPGDCWEEAEERILEGLTYLHRVGDVKYYGYL